MMMTRRFFNIGSINIDKIYHTPHFPQTGETVLCTECTDTIGGKGYNISIALARAGMQVRHIGAISAQDRWICDKLHQEKVDIAAIQQTIDHPTGEALIFIDNTGDNRIVVAPHANRTLSAGHISTAVVGATAFDWIVLQNETNHPTGLVELLHASSAKVCLVAAPFDVDVVSALLPVVDALFLNAVEAAALASAMKCQITDIPISLIVVTKGADGVSVYHNGAAHHYAAYSVQVVDTTGAGDVFTGYFLSVLEVDRLSATLDRAVQYASAAAALHIQQVGTGEVIPRQIEVDQFIAKHATISLRHTDT